jgi:hypothetical protein
MSEMSLLASLKARKLPSMYIIGSYRGRVMPIMRGDAYAWAIRLTVPAPLGRIPFRARDQCAQGRRGSSPLFGTDRFATKLLVTGARRVSCDGFSDQMSAICHQVSQPISRKPCPIATRAPSSLPWRRCTACQSRLWMLVVSWPVPGTPLRGF